MKKAKGMNWIKFLLGILSFSSLLATGNLVLVQDPEIQSNFTFSQGVGRNTKKATPNNIRLNGFYACGFALKDTAMNKLSFAFGLERDQICYATIFGKTQGVAIGQGAFFIAADGQWIEKNKVSSFRDSALVQDVKDATASQGLAFNGQSIGQTKPKAVDAMGNQVVYSSFTGSSVLPIADMDKVFVVGGALTPAAPSTPVVPTAPVDTPAATPTVTPPTPAVVPAAPVVTPAAPAASAVTPTPVVAPTSAPVVQTPAPIDVSNITVDTVISAIKSGKLVTTTPDDAKALEAQSSINIVGESTAWKRFNEGFGTSPVQLSEKNGIICRFVRGNGLLIGNVYKNNRPEIAEIGKPICRASSDDGKVQVEKDSFEMLNKRGVQKVVWMPITSTLSMNWETGYRLFVSGKTVSENGQSFIVTGICRMPKADDPSTYHIGRAFMDNAGDVHCFLKKSGSQVDLTEEKLKGVEVLLKDSAAKSIKPAMDIHTIVPALPFSG